MSVLKAERGPPASENWRSPHNHDRNGRQDARGWRVGDVDGEHLVVGAGAVAGFNLDIECTHGAWQPIDQPGHRINAHAGRRGQQRVSGRRAAAGLYVVLIGGADRRGGNGSRYDQGRNRNARCTVLTGMGPP